VANQDQLQTHLGSAPQWLQPPESEGPTKSCCMQRCWIQIHRHYAQ